MLINTKKKYGNVENLNGGGRGFYINHTPVRYLFGVKLNKNIYSYTKLTKLFILGEKI